MIRRVYDSCTTVRLQLGQKLIGFFRHPIYLDDLGALTVSDVRSRCRRLKSTRGLSAIFIDYLQLLRPDVLARNINRNEELSEICRTLKATAKISWFRSLLSRSSIARMATKATSRLPRGGRPLR